MKVLCLSTGSEPATDRTEQNVQLSESAHHKIKLLIFFVDNINLKSLYGEFCILLP